jgi:hypothetical protein
MLDGFRRTGKANTLIEDLAIGQRTRPRVQDDVGRERYRRLTSR